MASLLLFATIPGGQAAESLLAFESPADEARYAELLEGYRCLKCQNQNLADSKASLAIDLRREIYDRVVAGEPTSAIDDYLVARYGEFVLYRPRLNAATLVLWAGPFVLLAVALVAAVGIARRSSPTRDRAGGRSCTRAGGRVGGKTGRTPSDEALATARQLLDD